MRRVGFAAAIVTIFAVNAASATCYGTVTFQNCDDSSGNGYTINHFGDTTIMTGGDAQTGGSWEQNSTTLGDTLKDPLILYDSKGFIDHTRLL
jgi:hypothetical protein